MNRRLDRFSFPAINAGLVAFGLVAACTLGCSSKTESRNIVEAEEVSLPVFQPPIRLMAGGKPIAMEAPGCACPTVADVDGDGRNDLVVGQFNDGNMLFCKNTSSSSCGLPELGKPEWLTTNGERAIVPGVW